MFIAMTRSTQPDYVQWTRVIRVVCVHVIGRAAHHTRLFDEKTSATSGFYGLMSPTLLRMLRTPFPGSFRIVWPGAASDARRIQASVALSHIGSVCFGIFRPSSATCLFLASSFRIAARPFLVRFEVRARAIGFEVRTHTCFAVMGIAIWACSILMKLLGWFRFVAVSALLHPAHYNTEST